MAEKHYLIEIITSLAENEVEFIICGGMAAVFHGVERMTMDLDISLNMNSQNIKKFLLVIKNLGLIPRVPVPPEALLDKKQVEFFVREKKALVFTFLDPDRPFRQIDVFLTGDKSYHLLKKHTMNANVRSQTVKIISVDRKSSKGFRDVEWKGEASDFDGHTDFHKMTFTEKLEWLSEAVVSVYLLAKDNPEAGCNSLFKT